MKRGLSLVCVFIFLISSLVHADDHIHHAKHNMVLFGDEHSFYASHLVYKVPHNFQVILKVEFDASLENIIKKEMSENSQDQFIFLLDQMDLNQINEKPKLSGQILRNNLQGTKIIVVDHLELLPSEYSIIYFDELPLSLDNHN